MPREHNYVVSVSWTGNKGSGTSGYRDFSRDHTIESEGPPPIPGSADPALRGDRSRWNPEQLLVASLSECHMLWYLHLCAEAGVIVTRYVDNARGSMIEGREGGRFVEVVLSPHVEVAEIQMVDTATRLHEPAHRRCFIANSVNFPVLHDPHVTTGSD